MGLRASLAVVTLLALLSGNAVAQVLVDGTDPDEVAEVARGYGSVQMNSAANGNPMISGEIEGVSYYLFFRNCSDTHSDCEDLNFYAGFRDNKQTLDAINAWNRDKRFGKAYLDSDLDAVIEYDVNLEYGISRENLDSSFSIWSLILKQFADYIGFER